MGRDLSSLSGPKASRAFAPSIAGGTICRRLRTADRDAPMLSAGIELTTHLADRTENVSMRRNPGRVGSSHRASVRLGTNRHAF